MVPGRIAKIGPGLPLKCFKPVGLTCARYPGIEGSSLNKAADSDADGFDRRLKSVEVALRLETNYAATMRARIAAQ